MINISNISTDKEDELKSIHFAYLKDKKVEYREYQVNIARKCFGNNSLVVTPTGLGKTIIGLFVAAHTLENYPGDSKVIVLAPTRPLINQHYESFLSLMTIPLEKFGILTGQVNPKDRITQFNDKQILFYTPQTLRNDIINSRYTLKNVCLIIFDEAHRAQGDYAYCQIADMYVEQNPDGIILALTASPGSSKTKVYTLCKNLHIPKSNIVLRTRDDKDVKKYIQPMRIWKVGVNMTEVMQVVQSALQKMTLDRLNYLSSLGFIEFKENLLDKTFRKDLVRLNRELLIIINGDGDKTGAYKALSVNAQTLRLLHMVNLVESQGLDALLSYLESMKSQALKKNASKALVRLSHDYEINKIFSTLLRYKNENLELLVHPKFNVCRDLILKELSDNSDARILVFSQLRDSVSAIVSKLKNYNDIRPKRFVGQATKSAKDKGLSQKKQIEILEKFKEGIYNVLVSTNVGEEGLDIAECDLVIFFDTVASEIRLIQRKGRTARFREGKVIILYCRGTSDEVYLHISLNRLKKMYDTLKENSKLSEIITDKKKIIDKIKVKKRTRLKDLTDFFSPLIEINKSLPQVFGIRQFLTKSNLKFKIVSNIHHIQVNGKLGIQIFNPRGIYKQYKDNELKEYIVDFKKRFNLAIILSDFVNIEEDFENESEILKKKLDNISEIYNIPIIPIDKKEELIRLLKGFLDKILKNK